MQHLRTCTTEIFAWRNFCTVHATQKGQGLLEASLPLSQTSGCCSFSQKYLPVPDLVFESKQPLSLFFNAFAITATCICLLAAATACCRIGGESDHLGLVNHPKELEVKVHSKSSNAR